MHACIATTGGSKSALIKATIIQVNTIHIMWMGNIEYEGDNLMLVDE
jgi:hypothetical protein